MNEATIDRATNMLLDMVNVTVKTMGDVVDFGKQQIPEVVHQLLMWNAVQSFMSFALSGIFFILGVLMMTRWFKRLGKHCADNKARSVSDYEEGKTWTRLYSGSSSTSSAYDFYMAFNSIGKWVLLFVGIMIAMGSLRDMMGEMDWLKIIIAPKVYLIEYAAQLVKTIK